MPTDSRYVVLVRRTQHQLIRVPKAETAGPDGAEDKACVIAINRPMAWTDDEVTAYTQGAVLEEVE